MDDDEVEVLGNTEYGYYTMDKTLEQDFFISEREMSQVEETRNSICNKFTTILFEEEDSIKSKLQTVKDYLNDVGKQ